MWGRSWAPPPCSGAVARLEPALGLNYSMVSERTNGDLGETQTNTSLIVMGIVAALAELEGLGRVLVAQFACAWLAEGRADSGMDQSQQHIPAWTQNHCTADKQQWLQL